jgi:hypothetical protein
MIFTKISNIKLGINPALYKPSIFIQFLPLSAIFPNRNL